MNRILLFFCCLLLSAAVYPQKWCLVWSDEFNTPGLPDSSKWDYEVGMVRNSELQYYTYKRIENAHIDDTALIIEARRESFSGASYTSASILSRYHGDWLYGRVEVRAKIPTGRGPWPAIWMMPTSDAYGYWPKSGELDIMENVGYEPNNIYTTVHYYGTNGTGHEASGKKTSVAAPYNNFYTYAVEWTPERIDWFIDSTLVHSYTRVDTADYRLWPFDKEFYLILNLAIGGNWGGVQGIDLTKFPHKYSIDYVRVYSWQTDPGPYTVNVQNVRGGAVNISPDLDSFPENTPVVLQAIPDSGYEFKGFLYISKSDNVKFNVVKNTFITPVFSKTGELILNGNFVQGLIGWNNIYINDKTTQAAHATVDTLVYSFSVDKPATDWWHMGDQSTGIPALNGATYKVEFDAWADKAGNMGLSFSKNHDNYSTYYEKNTIALTSQKKHITWQFKFSYPTDQNCRLYFGFGRFTGRIFMENVSMVMISPPPAILSETKTDKVIHVFPNPASQYFDVHFSAKNTGNTVLYLYDLSGRKLAKLWEGRPENHGQNIRCSLEGLKPEPGIYLLRAITENATFDTKLILE